MKLNLDIKTLITICGIAIVFGGFYYGTQMRLSTLESNISNVKTDNTQLQQEMTTLKKQVKNLAKKVSKQNPNRR